MIFQFTSFRIQRIRRSSSWQGFYQQIRASLDTGQFSFYNIQVHGEYRNRTRNKKWDMLLKAEFYVNGLNEGDYQVQAKLDRFLNKKWGHFSLFSRTATERHHSYLTADPRSTCLDRAVIKRKYHQFRRHGRKSIIYPWISKPPVDELRVLYQLF